MNCNRCLEPMLLQNLATSYFCILFPHGSELLQGLGCIWILRDFSSSQLHNVAHRFLSGITNSGIVDCVGRAFGALIHVGGKALQDLLNATMQQEFKCTMDWHTVPSLQSNKQACMHLQVRPQKMLPFFFSS